MSWQIVWNTQILRTCHSPKLFLFGEIFHKYKGTWGIMDHLTFTSLSNYHFQAIIFVLRFLLVGYRQFLAPQSLKAQFVEHHCSSVAKVREDWRYIFLELVISLTLTVLCGIGPETLGWAAMSFNLCEVPSSNQSMLSQATVVNTLE